MLKAGIDILLSMGIKISDEIQLALHDDISIPQSPYTNNILHVSQPTYQMGQTDELLINVRTQTRTWAVQGEAS